VQRVPYRSVPSTTVFQSWALPPLSRRTITAATTTPPPCTAIRHRHPPLPPPCLLNSSTCISALPTSPKRVSGWRLLLGMKKSGSACNRSGVSEIWRLRSEGVSMWRMWGSWWWSIWMMKESGLFWPAMVILRSAKTCTQPMRAAPLDSPSFKLLLNLHYSQPFYLFISFKC